MFLSPILLIAGALRLDPELETLLIHKPMAAVVRFGHAHVNRLLLIDSVRLWVGQQSCARRWRRHLSSLDKA